MRWWPGVTHDHTLKNWLVNCTFYGTCLVFGPKEEKQKYVQNIPASVKVWPITFVTDRNWKEPLPVLQQNTLTRSIIQWPNDQLNELVHHVRIFSVVFLRSMCKYSLDPFIGIQILKTYGFPIWRINFKVSRLAGNYYTNQTAKRINTRALKGWPTEINMCKLVLWWPDGKLTKQREGTPSSLGSETPWHPDILHPTINIL